MDAYTVRAKPRSAFPYRPADETARRGSLPKEETPMKRCLLLMCGMVALLASHVPASAQVQGAKGQNCHMEQQCHWENFKKVCVYVKVCR